MGAGASSQGIDLIATTMMLGQAIASITFPGMFRIYDFHSPLAPKLKYKPAQFNFNFYGQDSDEEEAEAMPPNPAQYEHMFHVTAGGDTIYIEDVLAINDSGWTALHSCCMSYSTVPAGIAIIEKVVSLGGSLDIKTFAGPGAYNKGWTPLQMASAYGIVPLVEKLVQEGADVNCTNSFGYSPLLEACHRGFAGVVAALLTHSPDLGYIPPESLASASPFVGAPPQAALAEAARSGFFKIVQDLIEAGAQKDLQNSFGWTALHEACFYNRIETAKVLLLTGASASIRTNLGALPYHLTELKYLREMLADMGGTNAVPASGDEVDMVSILKELTSGESSSTVITDQDGKVHIITGFQFDSDDEEYDENGDYDESQGISDKVSSSTSEISGNHSPTTIINDAKVTPKKESKSLDRNMRGDEKLLHSGAILGDLPALGSPSMGGLTQQQTSEIDAVLNNDNGQTLMTPGKYPSLKADGKDTAAKKKKKKKKQISEGVPPDMPSKYLCALTKRPMSEPVKSCFGHFFENSAIMSWFSQQGRICPLTGMPLCEADLAPMTDLGAEIREWILRKSSDMVPRTIGGTEEETTRGGDKKVATDLDNLYDF